MDDNSLIYKVIGAVAGVVSIVLIKPFWQAMRAGWDATSTNSNAQVQMINVLQAELDGYRRREAEGRDLLKEVYQLRLELKEAREQIAEQTKKIESQSRHIDEQSIVIEQLRGEIEELKNDVKG